MKLIVVDKGDPSVGINPVSWEVDVPFTISKGEFITPEEGSDLMFFRDKIIELYKEFCDGKCVATYDFEYEEETKLLQDIEDKTIKEDIDYRDENVFLDDTVEDTNDN